jgi:hypothetical protein
LLSSSLLALLFWEIWSSPDYNAASLRQYNGSYKEFIFYLSSPAKRGNLNEYLRA